MSDSGLMIGVSGIRGRVGEGFTPEVATRYSVAFGAWALSAGSARTVVLGRDSRISGPQFHEIVRVALESAGADVIDLGLTTTPTLQLAVEHHSRGRRHLHHRQPQSDRVERAEVIGADGLS